MVITVYQCSLLDRDPAVDNWPYIEFYLWTSIDDVLLYIYIYNTILHYTINFIVILNLSEC